MLRRLVNLWLDDSPSLLALSSLIAVAVGLVSVPVIARMLGPAGRGEVMAVVAAFGVAPVLIALGVPLEMRRLAALGDYRPVARAARLLWLLLLIPSIALAFFCDEVLFRDLSSGLRLMTFVGLSTAPLTMSWTGNISILVALRRFRSVSVLRICYPTVTLILLLGSLILGFRLTSANVVAFNVAGSVCAFFLGEWLIGVRRGGHTTSLSQLSKGGLKYFGSSLAESASSRLDQVLALSILGAVAAGYYSVALTVAGLSASIAHALAGAVFTPAANSPDTASFMRVARAGLGSIISIGIFVSVGLVLIVPWGVPLVFGKAFATAVPVTLLLCCFAWISMANYVASMLLAARGAGWWMGGSQLGSLALKLSLLFVLSAMPSALGAGIAVAGSWAVLFLLLSIPLKVYRSPGLLLPSTSRVRQGFRLLTRGWTSS